MYISNLITESEVGKWNKGDIITIDAQTGRGKSQFIMNTLYNYAKANNQRILYLIHRKAIDKAFTDELKGEDKLDIIDIKTYQSIDSKLKYGNFNLADYDYIVNDEFHYHISDSVFNKYTDLSLDKILTATDATRIYMSGTGEKVKGYIDKKIQNVNIHEYSLPRDYSYIKKLEFYQNASTIHKYINSILETDEKAIIFMKSATKAWELYKEYEDKSMFVCGESHGLYEYVDKVQRDDMLKNEKFESQLLFTTTVFEAGINLIDDKLVHIICDLDYNTDVLLQCIGRKRINIENESDYINLYIRNVNNQRLGGKLSQLYSHNDIANQFIISCISDEDEKLFYHKHGREEELMRMTYVDPISKKHVLNESKYHGVKCDIEIINTMIKDGYFGYAKYVANLLNCKYTIAEKVSRLEEITEYLKPIVGKRLLSDEREQLVKFLDLKDRWGKLRMTHTRINSYFEEENIPFTIDVPKRKKIKDKVTGKRVNEPTYWVVKK